MAESAPAAPAPVPDPALTPAASDLLAPQPAMSPEQAAVAKVECLGKAGFAEAVLSGNADAVRRWREITRALRPAVDQSTLEGQQYERNMNSLAILKAKADLSDEAWDHIAAGGPVSLAEREKALQAKIRNFADRAWVQAYLNGSRRENSEMSLINAILASRVGSHAEIEEFKAKAAKRLNGIK